MALQSSITTASIIAFSAEVHVRAQQKESRLSKYVEQRQFKGKSLAYDGFGTIEVMENSARFAPVVFSDMEFNRRKISKARFSVAVPIDRQDVEQMLTDPTGRFAEAIAMAFNRQKDRVIVAAMFADVQAGEDFENTITASQDGVLTVDATGGYTYEKLLEMKQNFIDNEVGNDMDVDFVNGISGGEHTDMMSELELTSGDYSHQYVVDKGEIQRAVGFQMVRFGKNGASGAPGILPTASGVRTSFSMAKGAICVGVSREVEIKVQPRNDIYDTDQVIGTMVIGAVRTEGVLIQKVTTTVK